MESANHKSELPEPLAGALFYVLLGPIVWALHLTLVYGGHTLLCALSVSSGARAAGIVSFIVIVTIVALGVLTGAIVAAISRRRIRDRGLAWLSFRDRAMMTLAFLAGVGVTWGGASALLVEPCLSLR